MNFVEFWDKLQKQLSGGQTIKNWTKVKGYLGDEFKVLTVEPSAVVIDTPNAANLQYVPKSDFEIMFNHWGKYCSGALPRYQLRIKTRFSKYTMSIIKHLESIQQ